MIVIGLDLSISSTGVCVYDTETGQSRYYVVGWKFTKKSLNFQSKILTQIVYNKWQSLKNDDYIKKEGDKTQTVYNIMQELQPIIRKYKPAAVAIEGVSFSSSGAVVDLAGLNYAVRMMLLSEGVNNIYVISPTQNKKFATSNGQAEKNLMIESWKKSDPQTREIPEYIKVDDIADAYFLARYAESLVLHLE